MAYFLRFMGWLILYSFLYFLVLDFMGQPPGQNLAAIMVTLVVSFPIWWFTWKKFEKTFGRREPEDLGGGKTAYFFSLRNPAMTYYLMVLKLFLLVMGANGIITLAHHEGAMRTFYIWNFVILYLYAIPFFVIKFNKLKKSLAIRLVVDDRKIQVCKNDETLSEAELESIDRLLVEEDTLGMLIEAGERKLYLGGPRAKGSSFYTEGVAGLYEKLRPADAEKLEPVVSIKEKLKEAAFKPAI